MPTPDLHRAPPSPLVTLNALLCTLSTLSSKTAASKLRASTEGLVSTPSAATLPETARPYLLTLHVLFPHCLLDALDLLDRGCVTRVVLAEEESVDERHVADDGEGDARMRDERAESGDPSGDADDSVDLTKAQSGDENNQRSSPRPASKAQAQAQSRASPPTSTTRIVGYDVASIPTSTTVPTATSTASGTAAPATSTTDTPRLPWSKDADLDRTTRHHAVHLRSWTCTCPAFAFAAYARPVDLSAPGLESRGTAPLRRGDAYETRGLAETRLGAYSAFGGLCAGGTAAPSGEDAGGMVEGDGLGGSVGGKREQLPPVCKHLLACVLGELCPGFFGTGYGHVDGNHGVRQEAAGTRGVRESNVSVQEAAGWVGGGIL